MKPRKQEIDHITPQTRYSQSFLVSLGYKLELVSKGDTRDKDVFMVTIDGVHVPFRKKKGAVPYIKRDDFYSFARGRHKALRLAPLGRKIAYCID